MTTTRSTVTGRPGLLARLRLTEPVRLYAYGLLVAIVPALVLAGALSGQWAHVLTGIAAAVLAVVPAAEAARASVYSPASHIRDLMTARSALTAAAQVERAAGL